VYLLDILENICECLIIGLGSIGTQASPDIRRILIKFQEIIALSKHSRPEGIASLATAPL